LNQVNPQYKSEGAGQKETTYEVIRYDQVDNAELDEMWSYVKRKKNQRWLWLAVDHDTRDILAYTFGKRRDKVFLKFKKLLDPFGIKMFYTDDWGSYSYIPAYKHTVGKRNTQIVERKNLTLRTRIKRLARKTICHSKSTFMHDTVIGLVINILAFGWSIFTNCNTFRT
jgi:insertion element IS1 protein InsB